VLCALPPPLGVVLPEFGEARRSASGAKAAAFKRRIRHQEEALGRRTRRGRFRESRPDVQVNGVSPIDAEEFGPRGISSRPIAGLFGGNHLLPAAIRVNAETLHEMGPRARRVRLRQGQHPMREVERRPKHWVFRAGAAFLLERRDGLLGRGGVDHLPLGDRAQH